MCMNTVIKANLNYCVLKTTVICSINKLSVNKGEIFKVKLVTTNVKMLILPPVLIGRFAKSILKRKAMFYG